MPRPIRPVLRRRPSGRAVAALVPVLLALSVAAPASALAASPTPTPSSSSASTTGTTAGTAAASADAAAADPSPSGSPSPTPDPDEVAKARALRQQAEQQVAAFQAQVAQADAQLTAGTQRLADEQAALAKVQGDQVAAEQRAADAVARSKAASSRLAIVIGRSYMQAVPSTLQLALTSSPEQVQDAVVARQDLDRVQGSSADAVLDAKAAKVEADGAVRTASQLTDAATRKAVEVSAQVDQLKTLAEQNARTLAAANASLVAARQSEQAAVADAAAQALAAENARKAALLAAQNASKAQAAALAAALAYRGVLATCAAQPSGTLVNGFLDPSMLCPLDDAPGKALQPTAAAAFNAMNAAYKAATGAPICVTDSYRSYVEQVAVYAEKPNLAAIPGHSNHGLGVALDLCGGIQDFGAPAHAWMLANAPSFGWFHPAWAEPGGAKPEAWHWEYADGDHDFVTPSS